MKRLYFGKLVTDDIPRKIEKDGQIPRLQKLKPHEFEMALRAKVLEEAGEVRSARTPEELLKEAGQLSAWLGKLLEAYGITPQQLAAEVKRFKKTRGFERNFFLRYIDVPEDPRSGQR